MERDRKKERTKRVKGSDGGGSKKAAQAAAGAMVAGVPAAMPVSDPLCGFVDFCHKCEGFLVFLANGSSVKGSSQKSQSYQVFTNVGLKP